MGVYTPCDHEAPALQKSPGDYVTNSIKSRADALANLPSRARWFPQGDAANSAMSKRKSETPATGSSDLTCLGRRLPASLYRVAGWTSCRPSISSVSPKRF
jgi:hypothetical protein